MNEPVLWSLFAIGLPLLLALDLGVFHRHSHVVSFREAAIWSGIWFSLAVAFGAGMWASRGAMDGMEFATGYLIELSLSVDNVFLFAVIFTAFRVPAQYQHRVLFWGILSAVAMRGAMIAGGAALLARFHWLIWVFGAFLILTGIKMFLHRNREMDAGEGAIVRFLRSRMRVTETFHGSKFLVRIGGQLWVTPLMLVLILVECTDLMFALDSIPAIFAITTDPTIVFASNVFAILGLRSLYFLLSGMMDRFTYLKIGLSGIMVFVGFKMLGFVKIPTPVSLAVVALMIAVSVAASLLRKPSAHLDKELAAECAN